MCLPDVIETVVQRIDQDLAIEHIDTHRPLGRVLCSVGRPRSALQIGRDAQFFQKFGVFRLFFKAINRGLFWRLLVHDAKSKYGGLDGFTPWRGQGTPCLALEASLRIDCHSPSGRAHLCSGSGSTRKAAREDVLVIISPCVAVPWC